MNLYINNAGNSSYDYDSFLSKNKWVVEGEVN